MFLNSKNLYKTSVVFMLYFIPATTNSQTIEFNEERIENMTTIEKDLILALSNEAQEVRDSCANQLQEILFLKKNVIATGNIIENSTGFWENKIKELETEMSKKMLHELFDLKDKVFSMLNQSVSYQIDNSHKLNIVYERGYDKLRKVEVVPHMRGISVDIPVGYSGKWRNYYRNGIIRSEQSFENGIRNGEQRIYNFEGVLLSSSNYIENRIINQKQYTKEGRLRRKREYDNSFSIITTYDGNGKITTREQIEKDQDCVNLSYSEWYQNAEIVLHGEIVEVIDSTRIIRRKRQYKVKTIGQLKGEEIKFLETNASKMIAGDRFLYIGRAKDNKIKYEVDRIQWYPCKKYFFNERIKKDNISELNKSNKRYNYIFKTLERLSEVNNPTIQFVGIKGEPFATNNTVTSLRYISKMSEDANLVLLEIDFDRLGKVEKYKVRGKRHRKVKRLIENEIVILEAKRINETGITKSIIPLVYSGKGRNYFNDF